MLPSPGTRINRSQHRAARRSRSLSLRLEHRYVYSRRIDRMLATDPQEQACARRTGECSAARSRGHHQSRPAYAHQPRGPIPRLTPTTLSPRGVSATDRPQRRAASLTRVSLPHTQAKRWQGYA
jgi:hypothetical protein